MRFRTFSHFAVGWIILIDMIIIKNEWFSKRIFPYPELIHAVRIVIPLLMSVGVGYYIVQKKLNEEAVEEEWWRVILLLCLLLLVSILVFFRWY